MCKERKNIMTSERIRKALISAVQRQIAKPVQSYLVWDEVVGECPSCYQLIKRNADYCPVGSQKLKDYCPLCGQKLKWGTPLVELKPDSISTISKEPNLEPPCDTIQAENASNADAKVEVAVPDDWYGETNTVYLA